MSHTETRGAQKYRGMITRLQPSASQGKGPEETLIFDFQPQELEGNIFLLLKSPILWYFVGEDQLTLELDKSACKSSIETTGQLYPGCNNNILQKSQIHYFQKLRGNATQVAFIKPLIITKPLQRKKNKGGQLGLASIRNVTWMKADTKNVQIPERE